MNTKKYLLFWLDLDLDPNNPDLDSDKNQYLAK